MIRLVRRVSLFLSSRAFHSSFVFRVELTLSTLACWLGLSFLGVRWMERVMPDCTLRIMKGESHNLLSSTKVVIEVLESIAKEAETF